MAYTTIDNPELYFQVKLYTGNGTDDTAITLDGDENMSPNLIWIKPRNDARGHHLQDTIRGVNNALIINESSAEYTGLSNVIKSFDSDGFTLGTSNDINKSSNTHVAWCWKETADAGFDIVSYTGNGSNQSVSHSLSAVPHLIIQKSLANGTGWWVYHQSLGATKAIYMHDNAAPFTNDWLQDTAPTSSVFTLDNNSDTNASSQAMIAYLWSEKQGFSKFGSFISNNTSDNAFIYTGFAPSMVFMKSTTSTNNWVIQDIKRPGLNPAKKMYPDLTNTEDDDNDIDFLSNGFKMRGALGANTFIYMAWAETPLVNSKGVPNNAR